MKNTLTYLFLLCSLFAQAQEFTAALPHVDSVWRIPSNSGSRFQFHKIEGRLYVWNPNAASWSKVAQGVDVITGSIPPAYTPSYQQSEFAINAVDSLYRYRAGAWRHLNPGGGGGGGGTWGSITGTLSDQTDLQAALDAKTSDVLEGYGVDATYAGNDVTVKVDTTVIPTSFGAASVYRLWPKGHVDSYQPSTAKRNWKIFYNSIQAASGTNSYTQFDTITSTLGSTTNHFGNGIWMATTGTPGQAISGFSNHLQAGLGFKYLASGQLLFSDWKVNSTRGSILTAMNWTNGGSGDMAVTFYKSASNVTSGIGKTTPGEEIGVIRFVSADSTYTLASTPSNKTFTMNTPCAAIVGYNFKKPWNNAYYGGVGIWTTNGSLTQFRAVAVDSTFSTTVRAGINVVPSPANTLQVAGKTAIAGNLELTTAGNKIFIATGTNASAGTATLVGGTITVNTTAVTSNSIFYVTCKTPIVTQGNYSVPTIVDGVSFTINSTSVAENSIVYWTLIN